MSSPPHPHTVTIVAEDDDDNDICPVCDGQCTCSNNSPYYHRQPTPSPPRDPPKPVLKIKLPAALLKRKFPSSAPASSSHPPPKRRGRPPKNPALRAGPSTSSSSALQRPKSNPAVHPRKSTAATARGGGSRKKSIKKRKRVHSTDGFSSDLTDIDHLSDDDAHSVQFPTFVSAASSNSSASSSDSSSLSGFETDSSIEAEEENFILAEERARVRRELLHGGGGEESLQKRRDNNWVIRPRQKSVGAPSDVEMDADSDATEDADDDDDDEDQEDDDEPDGEDTEDVDARRFGHSGLVTAWSDDEESSFDADLFFANLSDHESDSSGSSTQSDDGQEGDYSDLDLSETAASLIPHLRQGVGIGIPNLAFELTEGWDGQVVFTNGLLESSSRDGFQHLLESAFLPPGPEASPSPGPDGDVDMLSTDAGEPDEEGYEQDVDQDTAEAEGEGDTTDEELVGDDDLPNERAMSLFNTPYSFTAINPLSTMSPVGRPFRHDPIFGTESPRPSDILAHRMQWETNDIEDEFDGELDEEESPATRERKEKDKAARGGLPRTGFFEILGQTRQAVIDGDQKDIPSSYPRFTGRRDKSLSLSLTHGRTNGAESMLRNSLSTPLRPSSLPPPSSRLNFLSSTEDTSLAPSATITSPGSTSASQWEDPVSESISIDLDEVLDASLLIGTEVNETTNADEPITSSSSVTIDTPNADPSTRQYNQSLNRWDVISVGALRKTGVLSASAAGWGSDSGPDYAAYSNVMRSSPLSTMLWHNRNGAFNPNSKQRAQRSMEYVLSPEFGPVKDGERTPTNAGASGSRNPHRNHNEDSPSSNFKSRKEARKERKLKRKSYGSVNQYSNRNHHPKQHQHRHHHHAHHPNAKFRSTSSSQRTNFFSSPVPPLSI